MRAHVDKVRDWDTRMLRGQWNEEKSAKENEKGEPGW